MLRDIRKNKIFNRRVFILGIGQSILTSFLLLRLGYLQIWKHNQCGLFNWFPKWYIMTLKYQNSQASTSSGPSK